MSDVSVRDAVAADWDAIYPIFAAIVADGRTYACRDDLSSDAARALWMEPAPGRVVVAVREGVVVGTAKMGPNRPGRGSHVATASVMVDAAHQGRGIGRTLGDEVLTWSRDKGYRGIQFNAVVSTNAAAVHLSFDHAELGHVDLYVMYRAL